MTIMSFRLNGELTNPRDVRHTFKSPVPSEKALARTLRCKKFVPMISFEWTH